MCHKAGIILHRSNPSPRAPPAETTLPTATGRRWATSARFPIVSSTRSRYLVLRTWSVPSPKSLVRLQRAVDHGTRTTDERKTLGDLFHRGSRRGNRPIDVLRRVRRREEPRFEL